MAEADPIAGHSPRTSSDLPEQFGRYRILRKLGQGGMGSVYLAHDAQLDRPVALKVPRFAADAGPAARERFLREARAAATLQHPHICPVYDVGEIDGVPYLTMAFIEGRPLSELIRPEQPLPPRGVAVVVRKLALALHEAHAHGVIHRDLKPSNVLINPRREPVIMDFGLARRVNQGDPRLTQVGSVLGTPAYMAPEQVNGDGEVVGPACDIYSLGVILYELLTGRPPFEGPPMAVWAQVLTKEPEPASMLRPDLDPALEAICRKAMAKKAADRYASMTDLAAALADYLRGHAPAPVGTPQLPANQTANGPTAAPEGSADQLFAGLASPPDAGTATGPYWIEVTRHRRAPSLRWLALAVGIAALAGMGGFLLVRSGDPPSEAPRSEVAAPRELEPPPPKVEKSPEGKEPYVVATWVHQTGGRRNAPKAEHKLYSNGRIDASDSPATWQVMGDTLILRWPDPKAPGGVWRDTCELSKDGTTYSGANQQGAKVFGRKVSGEDIRKVK